MVDGHNVRMGEIPAGPIERIVVPIGSPHGGLPIGFMQLDREVGSRLIQHADIGDAGCEETGNVAVRVAVGYAAYDHAPGTQAPDWQTRKRGESRMQARPQPVVVLWDEQCGCGKAWWGDFGQSTDDLLQLVFAEVKRRFLLWQRLALARVSLVVVGEHDHQAQALFELITQTVPDTQIRFYFAGSAADALDLCGRLLGAGVEPVLLVREQVRGERGDVAPTGAAARNLVTAVRLRVRCIAWLPIDSPHEVEAPPWAQGCALFWPYPTDYQLVGAILDVAGVPRETADA